MENGNKRRKELGITISKTRVSMAFTLITFMVGELIYISKNLSPPTDLRLYTGLNEDTFTVLRDKMLRLINIDDQVRLNTEESIDFYMLVDLVCKCFVNDANEQLRDLASENLEINSEEYTKVRMSYLHYAESLLSEVNEKFQDNRQFVHATAKFHDVHR